MGQFRGAMALREINPMEVKKRLAGEIVAQFHGGKVAQKAQKEFEQVFQKRSLPQEVPVVVVGEGVNDLVSLLMAAKLVASRSEAKRQIAQGAVEVD
ncbi:MAG: tyrosine--tRNA ligase, partial [Chloroflexota bacterium]